MKKVTVVIPNYNGIRFLNDCLGSLYLQEPGTPEYDVLVVDNGSRDGSVSFLREHFPQAALEILPENTGFCHAVNLGIQKSATPYVILLNNDTRVEPGFIRRLCAAIEQDPRIFSVSASMRMWDKPELLDDAGDGYCVLGWAYARGKGKPAALYSRPGEVFSACGGAAIYRREIFNRIGLFDENHFAYLEDLDIGWRARIYGYRNCYEPAAVALHFGSASTGSRYNPTKTRLAAANSVYVAGKNMPALQLLWNLPFLIAGCFFKFLFFCRKGMGGQYLRGLGRGFQKLFSRSGRERRIPFRFQNIGRYLEIQWQLYLNLIRFLKKT